MEGVNNREKYLIKDMTDYENRKNKIKGNNLDLLNNLNFKKGESSDNN